MAAKVALGVPLHASAARPSRSGPGAATRAASGTRWSKRSSPRRPRGGAHGRTGARAHGAVAAPVRLGDIAADAAPRYRPGWPSSTTCWAAASCPGSLVLVGGEPGIGKSTLLLQVRRAARGRRRARRSTPAARSRRSRCGCARTGSRSPPAGVPVLAETVLERVIEQAAAVGARVVVVDSIQTAYTDATSRARRATSARCASAPPG